MADHGELLTKFEGKFGSVVEHEVIKLILQTSGWDSRVATETLMGMIDENDLPPHVRHALGAEMMLWNAVADVPSAMPVGQMNAKVKYPENNLTAGCHQSPASDFPQYAADRTPQDFQDKITRPHKSPGRSSVSAAGTGHDHQTANWILTSQFEHESQCHQSICDTSETHSPKKTSASKRDQSSAKSEQMKAKMSKKDNILAQIQAGESLLILMRGLPGSGKTTLARELKGAKGVILSTDDFFCDKQGRYNYNPAKIGEAHQWNRRRTQQRLQEGRTPIFVDNTNLQQWELKPYVQLALQYGYKVDILDADTPWKLSPAELARKNAHGVPKKKIIEMKDRYENTDIEKVIAALLGTQTYTKSDTEEDVLQEEDVPECGAEVEVVTEDYSFLEHLTDGATLTSLSQLQASYTECGGSDDDADVVIEGYEDENDAILRCISAVAASGETQQAEGVEKLRGVHLAMQDGETTDGNESTACQASETDMQEGASVEDNCISDQGGSREDPGDSVEDEEVENTLPERSPEVVAVDPVHCQTQEEGICQEIKSKVLSGQEVPEDHEGVQDEADWGEAAPQVSAEISDEVFSGLVETFGSALKLEIEKKQTPESADRTKSCGDATHLDDSAMYELLRSKEENLSELRSSVLKESVDSDILSSDMFVIVNDCNGAENTGDTTERSEKQAGVAGRGTDSVDDRMETEEQTATAITNVNISQTTATDTIVPDKEESKFTDCKPDDNKTYDEYMYKTGLESVATLAPDKPVEEETDIIQPDPATLAPDKPAEEETDTIQPDPATLAPDKPAVGETDITKPDPAEAQPTVDSLLSWECVGINAGISSMNWNPSETKSDNKSPKPTRGRRKRIPGDPTKWLTEQEAEPDAIDPLVASWKPVEVGTPEWDSSEPSAGDQSDSARRGEGMEGASPGRVAAHLTGAVPKSKKRVRTPRSHSGTNNSENTRQIEKTTALLDCAHGLENTATAETQTLAIDFEAVELDNNLYELKIMYGRPDYSPHITDKITLFESGPLTKGKLKLDKGTMTESAADVTLVSPLQNLIDFFPSIPEDSLKDVFEKCGYDVDWAMNVLLDGGYEMANPVERTSTEDLAAENMETGSTSETGSTTGDGNYDPSFADISDVSSDILAEERTARRQNQQSNNLKTKKAIEQSFSFSNSVSDTVTRLTGKDVNELNSTRLKEARSRKKQGGKKNTTASPKSGQLSEESGSNSDGAISGAGAQYITLVMDSLFASQLTHIFGPVGTCEISGDLTQEDRSVILPLEFCHMIHKYWAQSLDGKFKHEAEVLDSMIREDENLARRLQEEEESRVSAGEREQTLDETLQVDPPSRFQEIMDIEQAVHNSKDKKSPGDLSSRLNLQRLYAEYPHVDKVALQEEFENCDLNYSPTVEALNQRYGSEQGTPKNVIAPEVLYRYEQQMIEQAERKSLAVGARAEAEVQDVLPGEDQEYIPDDPQVYRDEAQIHYLQRQEAYRKAQEASGQGMKAVAAYYARAGNIHSVKMKEANDRASKKILEATNANMSANCLDLHHLHVPEALSATQAFMAERYRVLTAYEMKQMQVSIITGRGARSAGGQARLKPAIKEFLQKHGYTYHEVNSGKLTVTLKS